MVERAASPFPETVGRNRSGRDRHGFADFVDHFEALSLKGTIAPPSTEKRSEGASALGSRQRPGDEAKSALAHLRHGFRGEPSA